jgi:ribosomal protein RSM22 (predicted rRNA methylase)
MNSDLQEAVEKLVEKVSVSDLTKARDALTAKYREPGRYDKLQTFMSTDHQRLSYLITRMPATYAVISHVLAQVKTRMPDLEIKSLLDLGSGPGTAFFASIEVFSEMQEVLLIEQDKELIRLGKLLSESIIPSNFNIDWQLSNINSLNDLKPKDLVTISYAMNELKIDDRQILTERAFNAANKVLVIIEPGTKDGFSIIRQARDQLIAMGGKMVAPCPHQLKCPMPENDWCHFSERINRTSLHRHLKSGQLGHEDEKFSYVVISKSDAILPHARILRHPEKHSGHLKLSLCTKENGLVEQTLSKRDGEAYKLARKLDWGDSFS